MKEESREESRENNSFCVVGIGASAGGAGGAAGFFQGAARKFRSGLCSDTASLS